MVHILKHVADTENLLEIMHHRPYPSRNGFLRGVVHQYRINGDSWRTLMNSPPLI